MLNTYIQFQSYRLPFWLGLEADVHTGENTWQDAGVSAEERHVTYSQTRKISADGLTSYSRLKIKIKH